MVDDDVSFRTAIERRLKLAGYEVATYPSAQQLLDPLPDDEQAGMHPARRADTGPERSRSAEPPDRARLDAADGIPDRVRRHADDRAGIKAGAEDFLTKPVSSEQLIDAIERAIGAAARCAQPAQQARDVPCFSSPTLTQRERQVFELIVRGKINKQIAHELGTTERTVKAHRHQVMEKMQVHSLRSWFRSRSGSECSMRTAIGTVAR